MGCRGVALEVSKSALDLGQKLTFLPFEGFRISLEDESIDRSVCYDTLHHIPNPELQLRFRLERSGQYPVNPELVSEGVIWFEKCGSPPAFPQVHVVG